MKLNRNRTNKSEEKWQKFIVIMMVVAIGVVMFTAMFLTEKGNSITANEVQRYLSELSFQTSYKVNQQMNTNLATLKNLQNQLNIVSEDERQQIIDNTIEHSAFMEIGYINADGAFINEHGSVDVSDTNVVFDVHHDNDYSISDHLVEVYGKQGIIYAVHSDSDETLAGFIPTDTTLLLLNTDTFKGGGFSHVVSKDGDFIMKSQNKNAVLTGGDNFLEELLKLSTTEESKEDIAHMEENLKQGEAGFVEYMANDEARSLTYIPLENKEWYLLSIVSPDAYVSEINQYIDYSILLIAGISILLICTLAGFIFLTSLKKLSDIEYVDPVTEGFTKSRFNQEIKRLFDDFSPFTYVVLDIRKFKLINDIAGSEGGNAVLKYVYNCINKHLNKDEFAARLQADHFEIALQTTDKEEISNRLLLIAEEINKFNNERMQPYYLQIDCGIYIVDEVSEDLVIIRDRANSARKSNIENKQNHHLFSCVYYNDLKRLQMVHEKEIDNSMEKALENGEFVVYMQPKIDVATNKVAGAEALVRWNSPTMGFLAPDTFIPYFEKTGFIVKVDEYVFERVCQQIRQWIDEGKKPVRISVNMSRRDLYDEKYLERYKGIQEKYQIPSHLLEIEFTENLFFENLELLKKSVKEVHEAGFLCSIDDFGSGYSSLSLLKELPVDILKLDKTFFDDKGNQRGDKVVKHVIALANDLHMETIAEGVETRTQVEQLKKMKCDLIQGYVYYKPMTIENFNKIVERDYEIISIE